MPHAMPNFSPDPKSSFSKVPPVQPVPLEIKVLIVDDSESDRATYRRYLTADLEHTYGLIEAETLEEGVELWLSHQPPLVLLDINLPDGNGLELLETIAADLNLDRLPVIVLTGQGDEQTAVQAMKLGAADYLNKNAITAVSLRTTIAQVLDRMVLTRQLARSQQQAAVIAEMALRVRQSLNLEEILNAIVQEVHEFLGVDRVMIYRFQPDMSGVILAEAVRSPWLACLGMQVEDTCFQKNQEAGEAYRQGRVFIANDIENTDLSECHHNLLAQFQVKANLVVPILISQESSQKLWGLLVVHQCAAPRRWQATDVDFLQQLSVHLAIALQQAELYRRVQTINASLEQTVQKRTQALQLAAQQQQSLNHIASQIRASLDLQTILDTAVQEIRELLQCDRVIIYQFRPDYSGIVVAEATLEGAISVLHNEINNSSDTLDWLAPYCQGYIRVINDVSEASETFWPQERRISFGSRANLMVSLLSDAKLWGLLMMSHQEKPWQWQDDEINLAQQLSIQVSIAIQQATAYHNLQVELTQRQKAEAAILELNQTLEEKVAERTANLQNQEETLRNLSDRLDLALKSGAIGIWDWEIPANMLSWDDRMYELYGIDPNQFEHIYDAWFSRVHPDDRSRINTAIQRALSGEEDYNQTFRVVHPDGDLRYIKAYGLVNRNAQGDPLRMTGINYDITEQTLAEAALRKSETHLRTAQRVGQIGSWEFNPYTEQVTWSAEIFEIFGLPLTESAPAFEMVQALIHPDDRDHHLQVLQSAIKAEQSYEIELRICRPDGALAYILARGEPLYSDDSVQGMQMVGTVQDLTRRKEAEQQLQAAKDAAESANRAKSEFLALMSHEIRTPMNAILGLSYLALQIDPHSPQQPYLNKIQVAAESLLQILNDILDFSKIESGKLELEMAPFGLDDILSQLTNILALKASEKGIELVFHVEAQVPRYVVGDSLRLRQVLLNLVSNGIKFTDQGGVRVSITLLSRTPDTVRLQFQVQDTGIGLTAEQIGKLFEAFTQADASISRKYSGTGLGLSICKRLVTLMGGTIGVDSQIGKGSTFYFEVELGHCPSPDSEFAGETVPDLQGFKALVVDDNPLTRETLMEILASFGFSVTTLNSGVEALEHLHQTDEQYKLLLIDWCMPELNGIETVRRIKADPHLDQVPHILMVTAYHRESLRQQATELGIQTLLPKPFSRSLLYNAILESFGHVQAPRRNLSMSFSVDQYREVLQGARVLVVEDNEVNQQIAQELLESVGIQVDLANTGQMGLDQVQAQPYDAILMDIQMPCMDGFMVTRLIRNLAIDLGNTRQERFATVPIIAMTAHAMSSDREKSLAAGMNDHVSKPINPQELFRVLVKWIAPETSWGDRVPTDEGLILEKEIEDWHLSLPGVNLAQGLERVAGNRQSYERLLKGFYRSHHSAAEAVQGALEASDREQLFYLLHTLKGSTGNLGAEALFQQISALETSVRSDQVPLSSLAPEIRDMTLNLQTLLTAIEALTLEPEPSPKPPLHTPLLSTPELRSRLTQVVDFLETDLPQAIAGLDTLKQQLQGTPLADRLAPIIESVLEFDTDTAVTRVASLLSSLDSI